MKLGSERAAQILEEALGRLSTWAILSAVILAAAITAGFTTHMSRFSTSAWAYGIYVAVLGFTLLAVLWYSLETRRLVRIQRDAAEIADHPWLHVAGWPTDLALRADDMRPFGGMLADLPVKNVGRTPALLRNILVQYEIPNNSDDSQVIPGGDANPRVLAPGQEVVTRIAEVQFGGPHGALLLFVTVSVTYYSVHGGTGRVTLRFRFQDGVWKSRETNYECTLSSGLRLPRGVQNLLD